MGDNKFDIVNHRATKPRRKNLSERLYSSSSFSLKASIVPRTWNPRSMMV